MVHIELSDLPLDGTSLWRDLQPRPGKKDKIKGSIRVSFVPGTKPMDNAGKAMAKSSSTADASSSSQVSGRIMAANEADATELDLTGCNLSDIPEGVLAVPEWTSLDLGFNIFTTFPESLCNFKFLAELFLSGNRITSIPASIGRLGGSLRSLYLNGNFITSLPKEIEQLTNLEKLDVANNQLKFLPAEIGLVSQLEELRLNGNPINTLPAEMGKLQYLITLDLNGCALATIPEKCLVMPRLLELDLGTNQLTSLPSDFGSLTRLVTLNLADNQLTDLPMSMGKCESMDSCQLERNPIINEALMAKYAKGTDHLIDYLSKRVFEYEQVQKAKKKQGMAARPKLGDFAKNADEVSASSSSSSSSPSDANPKNVAPKRPKLSDFARDPDVGGGGGGADGGDSLNWVNTGLGGSRNGGDDDDDSDGQHVVLTAEEKEQIAWQKLTPQERAVKKRYAAQALAHQIRQSLVSVKKGVMLAKSIEECLPWAKVTRDLKNEADAIVDIIGRYDKPQAAPLFPHETKFQQLKKTTLVALKEVEAINNAVLNLCSTLITEDRVDAYRLFLRRSSDRLVKELGDPNAPPQ